jgi:hypothetical protein
MIFSRHLKLSLVALALLSGFSGFQWALKSLSPENVAPRDFLAEYLIARALLAGVNPYQSLPDLNKQFQAGDSVLPHPSPHTPSLAIFFSPLALFSYERAARIWLLAQILFLSASVFLLFRGFNISVNPFLAILVSWAALGWSHVWEDLIWGQINTALLLLIVGAWLKLRSGRQGLGGALLGAAISLKLIFWPLALFLALSRRWVSAIMALAVFAVTNLIAAAAMGWRVVAHYYLDIGPSTAVLYRACSQNLSLWSVGWRAFLGTGTPAMTGIEAPPIFFSPRLALGVSVVLTSAALALGLMASLKAERNREANETGNFDFAYGMMTCVCLLVSPITWPHYLILMALPASLIIQRLRVFRFPRRETLLYAIAVILLLIPDLSLESFIFSLSHGAGSFHDNPDIQPDMQVPFAAGILRLLPALSMLILAWLMRQLSRMSETRIDQYGMAQKKAAS